MFGFKDVELKQTRFYQQVHSEGRTEGEARLLERPLKKILTLAGR